MKQAFTTSAGASRLALTFALAVGMVGISQAQTVNALSGLARIDLTPHSATVAFVTSNANTAQEALQNTVISAAESKVIVAVASRTLPIPVIGSLPVEGVLHVLGKLRKHVVKGFDVEYLQGLSSEATVQSAANSFIVPEEGLQGASPVLLRIRPSTKDSARIVRSVRVTVKMTESQVNPASMVMLGIDQEVVPCRLESGGNGSVVLTPMSPLTPGEYAIVGAPNKPSPANALAGLVWDFRVQ
jgi:hypothetical protein